MTMLAERIAPLFDFLREHRRKLTPLLILTHDFPDPDALASAFALQHLAAGIAGIPSSIAYGGIIGRAENRAMMRECHIPARKLRAADLARHTAVALVDTQPAFGNNSFPDDRRATIVIDQHEPGAAPPQGECVILDTDCGATSALLARALIEAGIDLPKPLATALVYGILTDTQSFFRTNRSDVVHAYTELLPHCDMRALARIQNPPQRRAFFITVAHGIRQAVMYRSVLVSHLGEIQEPDVVSQIADLLLSYGSAKWTLCTGRHGSRLRVSLRAKRHGANAAAILRDVFPDRGEAGGHDTIAGGSMAMGTRVTEEKWRHAEEQLVAFLLRRLRIPAESGHTPFRE